MHSLIKLSELQIKEVIIIDNGKRLGHIYDLEIDPEVGKILSIILITKDQSSGFFSKGNEVFINWEQIETIGQDVILVRERAMQEVIVDEGNEHE